MYCKRCGANISADAKFCQNCGLQNPAPFWGQDDAGVAKENIKPIDNVVTAVKENVEKVRNNSGGKASVIIIIAVVVIALIAAVSSFGSNSIERDLKKELPREITSYILEADGCVHDLEVKKFRVERHSESNGNNIADCVIELEDDYMEMTMNVKFYCVEYNTGWSISNWAENSEPRIVVKHEPDKQKIQAYVQSPYKGFTTMTDELNKETCEYKYVGALNEEHKYITYTGTVSVVSKFENVDCEDGLNVYGWNSSYDSDIAVNWNIIGEWTAENINDNGLLVESYVINIQSVDSEPYYGGYGNYTGTIERTYRKWDRLTNEYTDEFVKQESECDGSYYVGNLYEPDKVEMNIEGITILADDAFPYQYDTISFNRK